MKIEIEYAFFLCIYMYIQAAAAFYTEKKIPRRYFTNYNFKIFENFLTDGELEKILKN